MAAHIVVGAGGREKHDALHAFGAKTADQLVVHFMLLSARGERLLESVFEIGLGVVVAEQNESPVVFVADC